MNRFASFIFVLELSHLITAQTNPECDSWNKIKESLSTERIQCTVTSICTGVICSGHYKDFDLKVKAEVDPCKKPVGIDVTVDIPKTKFRNLTHTLRDGDSYQLPEIGGSTLPLYLNVSIKEKLGRKVKVDLKIKTRSMPVFTLISNHTIVLADCKKLQQDNKSSVISHVSTMTSVSAPQIIVTKNCSECNENETCVHVLNGLEQCDCKERFVRDENGHCQEITEAVVSGKKCNMTIFILNECDENEICVQRDLKSKTGICECVQPFHEDSTTHRCIPDGPPRPDSYKHVALILSIVIPISLLIVCASCVFVLVKQRFIQRLRDRFQRVRRYEVVSIGDDDDEPLVA